MIGKRLPHVGAVLLLVIAACAVPTAESSTTAQPSKPPPTAGAPTTTTTTPSPTVTPPVVESFTLDGATGKSGPVAFSIPEDARAISLLVRSERPDALIQLETLVLGGTDRVAGGDDDRDRMAARHTDHEIIETGIGFVHEVQQGTFAFTYPFAPGWDRPPGPASVSFLLRGGGAFDLEILVLRAGDRTVLPVTVFQPGAARLGDEARERIESIIEPAGISVRWIDGALGEEVPASLDDVDDRRPGSDLHTLALAVAEASGGGANVVIVDALPGGVSGFSTGIPGPHDGSGMAVAVALRSQAETARTVAHEIAHLLGLRHLEDRSAKGVVVRNPITDTFADAYNLMQFGTHLTEGQIEILRMSPLLEPRA